MNKVWDEVEFLGVESFLQFDNTIFGDKVWHAQIGNQISEFLEGQHLRKDFVDYLDFLHVKRT